MWFRFRWVLLVLLILAGLILRGWDAFGPFDREFEGWHGGFFGIAARNHLEHGIDRMGWYPVLNPVFAGEPRPEAYLLYTNHPPTCSLLNWLSFLVFGENEWALRLPHLLASLATVLLVYLIGLRLIGTMGALIAAGMAATLPGLAFYGTLVNYENMTIAAMMALAWMHVRWSERGLPRYALLFCSMAFVAVSVDWMAAFLIPFFTLERLLPRGELKLGRRILAAFWTGLAGAVGVGAAIALHQVLLRANLSHLGLSPEQAGIVSMGERARELMRPLVEGDVAAWIGAQVSHVRSLMYLDVFLLGTLGFVLCLFPNRSCERARVVVFPGFLAGVTIPFAFFKHTLDQPTFWMYVMPFVCLAFGFVCSRAVNLLTNLSGLRRALGVIALVPFVLLNISRYVKLRDLHRAGSVTHEIGSLLAENTPQDMVLYVPAAAGWTFAHSYYARRSIMPLEPEHALKAAPLAALRDLDREGELIERVYLEIQQLHKQGLLQLRRGVLLPRQPKTAELAAECQAIESALGEHARFEKEALGSIDLLVIESQDDLVEGDRLVRLRADPSRMMALRDHLQPLIAIAAARDLVYTSPAPMYAGRGPLRIAGRWVLLLPEDVEEAKTMLQERAPVPENGSNRLLVLPAKRSDWLDRLRAACPDLAEPRIEQELHVLELPPPSGGGLRDSQED